MSGFVTAITDIITGIFGALVSALSSIGNVLFTTTEAGAISGPSPLGYLLILGIGIPLATWVFGKFFNWLKTVGKGNKS